jgi:integrase
MEVLVAKKKRMKGRVWVENLPDGRARLRTFDAHGRRKVIETYDDAEKAARVAAAANASIKAGAISGASGPSLRDFAPDYFDRRERVGSRKRHVVHTLPDERANWALHVERSPFIDLAMSAITTTQIEDWVQDLAHTEATQTVRKGDSFVRRPAGRMLGSSSIRHIIRIVRQCFDRAVAEGHIATNPARGVQPPRDADAEERWTVLDAEEQQRLAALPAPERTWFLAAIFLGVRQMELWRLRWGDIDLDAHEFTVRQAHRGRTKSEKTRRAPLLPQAVELLRAWKEVSKRTGPTDLVFAHNDGSPYALGYDGGWEDKRERFDLSKLENLQRRAARGSIKIVEIDRKEGMVLVETPGVRSRAGIAPRRHDGSRVTFHALRHTCATSLLNGLWGRQWTIEEISAYLGHSSINVTQRYARVTRDALAAAAQATPGGLAGTGLGPGPAAEPSAPGRPTAARGALRSVGAPERAPAPPSDRMPGGPDRLQTPGIMVPVPSYASSGLEGGCSIR